MYLSTDARHASLNRSIPSSRISSLVLIPSWSIASSSAGRPCVSQPKRRSTCLPRIVWYRGTTSFA
ncbi:Uncharacterised protein [Mycobacteroides abscessus]|nr:Uncharacterised protein [Mycobacteroides abscessus]